MGTESLKKLARGGLTAVTLALAGYLFWKQRAQLRLAAGLAPIALATTVLLTALGFLLQAYRYLIVIHKCTDVVIPFFRWFRVFMVGLFLNKLFVQLGAVYRAVRLKEDFKVPYTSYITSYVSFAWMDMCLNLAIAGAAVALVNPALRIAEVPALGPLGGALLVAATAPPLMLYVSRRVRNRRGRTRAENAGPPREAATAVRAPTVPPGRRSGARGSRIGWLHDKLSEVVRTTVTNMSDVRYVAKVALMAMIAFVHLSVLFYFCFKAFGVHLAVPELALFYALHRLSTHLNVTPGNLGLRELVYAALANELGIGAGQGILVSAVLRVLSYLVVTAIALPMGSLGQLRGGREGSPQR